MTEVCLRPESYLDFTQISELTLSEKRRLEIKETGSKKPSRALKNFNELIKQNPFKKKTSDQPRPSNSHNLSYSTCPSPLFKSQLLTKCYTEPEHDYDHDNNVTLLEETISHFINVNEESQVETHRSILKKGRKSRFARSITKKSHSRTNSMKVTIVDSPERCN